MKGGIRATCASATGSKRLRRLKRGGAPVRIENPARLHADPSQNI